ncbi:hypothetical protein [Escherichia phage vB_EcoM_CRJP21]|uniref:Uncharacterized protein n=1 Tax=Escherichia phage vB_Eco_slurp01 TaxID=1874688 RepID=A0A1C3S6K5_9CAUD|nr:hypothetical protein B1K96_15305 [Escherichia coli]WIL01094.1 hypothetical protein [Escherichia phage vB_EcoM_CRJP21]SCA80120.1 hypothetical protein PSLUR01_00143 [Escherichia phage vB_Eco_slurp01]
MLPFGRMMNYGNIAPGKDTVVKINSDENSISVLYSDGSLYMRGRKPIIKNGSYWFIFFR